MVSPEKKKGKLQRSQSTRPIIKEIISSEDTNSRDQLLALEEGNCTDELEEDDEHRAKFTLDEWEGDDWSSDSSSSSNEDNYTIAIYDQKETAIAPLRQTKDNIVSFMRSNSEEPSSSHSGPTMNSDLGQDLILFIQMSFCEYSLREWLEGRNSSIKSIMPDKAGDCDLRQTFDICLDLLNGLDYLHTEQSVIHRDIKPENILYNKNTNKWQICDFGLAKKIQTRVPVPHKQSLILLSEARSASKLSSGLGTSHYAAPEQRNSEKYSFSADIFSAGYVIFELFYPMSGLSERIRVFDSIRSEVTLLKSIFFQLYF